MSVESDLSYLKSLGTSESVLNALYEDNKDDFEVVELPFSEITSTAIKSFTVPVSFGANNVTLTLRKDLSDNEWWITEEGTVNAQPFYSIGRFTLNSFIHQHKEFTYIIVSPYSYEVDQNEKLTLQCMANCSLLLKY